MLLKALLYLFICPLLNISVRGKGYAMVFVIVRILGLRKSDNSEIRFQFFYFFYDSVLVVRLKYEIFS